jgi:hypothetical protein
MFELTARQVALQQLLYQAVAGAGQTSLAAALDEASQALSTMASRDVPVTIRLDDSVKEFLKSLPIVARPGGGTGTAPPDSLSVAALKIVPSLLDLGSAVASSRTSLEKKLSKAITVWDDLEKHINDGLWRMGKGTLAAIKPEGHSDEDSVRSVWMICEMVQLLLQEPFPDAPVEHAAAQDE